MYRILRSAVVIAGIALLVALTGAPEWTAGATASTATFKATDDTYVDSAKPNRNYGQRWRLRADDYPSVRRVLIRFRVTDVPDDASITSATLRLFVVDGSREAGSVHAVGGHWSEASTTWSNAPSVGREIADVRGRARVGTWVEADVTSVVSGNGQVDFYLVTDSANDVRYRSSEGRRHMPRLDLRWSTGVSPTPSPLRTPMSTPTPRTTPTSTPVTTSTPVSTPTPAWTPTSPPTPTSVPTLTPAPVPTPTYTPTPTATTAPQQGGAIWRPAPNATWQWHLTGGVDLAVGAEVYDIDWEEDKSVVDAIHAQGDHAICYISVGSWENWRPDRHDFPPSIIGNDYEGWPGERWLDIRSPLLRPLVEARLQDCADKGFDGVEPDNMDIHNEDTGFPITYQDQLEYAQWLTHQAHARGLSIFQKNAWDMTDDLVGIMDGAIVEECFEYGECGFYEPYVAAGKWVGATEYVGSTSAFCPYFNSHGFAGMKKNYDLDAWRKVCW